MYFCHMCSLISTPIVLFKYELICIELKVDIKQ